MITATPAAKIHPVLRKNLIVLADFMLVRGGAERVTLELVDILKAPLYTAFIDDRHFPELRDKPGVFTLTSPTGLVGWQLYKAWRGFAQIGRSLPPDTKTLVYSGAYCLAAALNRPQARHLLYCHTPPRFLYDLRDYYLGQATWWQKPLLQGLIAYLQPRYEQAFRCLDRVIANSETVRQRIRRYLGRDSQVIYPPCDTEAFRWLGQRDYYLSTARLEPYKRVELIVRAFLHLPDRKLIVASGGSELTRLRRLAAGYDNIHFTGWLTQSELRTLIGNAIATLYLPRHEDFGMSAVESMAAGKPVIGVAEGGLLETVHDQQTGLLIPSEPSLAALIDAVMRMTPAYAQAMREACEQRAVSFGRQVFRTRMRSVLESLDD
jgi:glycosyltransferase involved in cell wall biosynthesis